MKSLTPAEKQYVAQVLERKRVYDTHVFDDETDFCIRCGQHVDPIVDQLIECFGQPGVIAISHRVRMVQSQQTDKESYVGMNFMDALAKFHEDNRPDSA